jgi:hypothetical protein
MVASVSRSLWCNSLHSKNSSIVRYLLLVDHSSCVSAQRAPTSRSTEPKFGKMRIGFSRRRISSMKRLGHAWSCGAGASTSPVGPARQWRRRGHLQVLRVQPGLPPSLRPEASSPKPSYYLCQMRPGKASRSAQASPSCASLVATRAPERTRRLSPRINQRHPSAVSPKAAREDPESLADPSH